MTYDINNFVYSGNNYLLVSFTMCVIDISYCVVFYLLQEFELYEKLREGIQMQCGELRQIMAELTARAQVQ